VIPYADSLYFHILIYPALLALLLGGTGRLSWRWVAAINLAMLGVQYSVSAGIAEDSVRKIWVVAGYGLFQWLVAALFLRQRSRGASRAAFRLAIAASLLPLILVKFVPLPAVLSYVGFLGISYVTFRSLDVIICVQDRLIRSLPLARFVTFILFFPTVSSGPLDRYTRFVKDCERQRTRREWLKDVDSAVPRFFRGLLYKFILGTLVKQYWLDPVSGREGLVAAISYMYGYTAYLFFDLAGYSALAIGVSYLLGIHTPENFNRPFLARDIVDFWNRWHMTLSAWFRDHVYMRFIMAAMRGRWFRSRLVLSCVGFYVSFGLMGVWHGTATHYMVYGAYHATLLSLQTILTHYRKPDAAPGGWARHTASVVLTFHLVAFGLLIFSGRLG
jgi:membrane protein involved in D-alanine export